MSIDQILTSQERLADLDLDQLRQLVGLVEYDAAADPAIEREQARRGNF